ncbi:COX5B-domain-containing protein [Punctularia strigosozonata HHB-11173 SS5]|uniref:Cytochrome c oxidase subunit 4, mitochondrial n=1 Tax=Punctularia strigosozonata (strain HHB-11173) TaxID=741275 RepID=R7S5Q2_PUNST|nr:COX5B-domain-containing protein [Punctularia strigosozonata HHB-11173 SS5]EIN04861.1 COX5B-domain-containing protein [Punctularia strigosozonata HHB-11173 SS5]
MLNAALRAARPAALVARSAARRSAARPAARLPARALSTTALRASDHGPKPPSLFGPGGKPGEVPTDEEQATGLERLQLLGELEGVDVFDMDEVLDSSRLGTLADPVKVPSLAPARLIGCTGVPADSHDVIWMNLEHDKVRRCGECGSVYALDYKGDPEALHGEHAHH